MNYVRLASDSGDYIGAGQTHEYNQTNAVITVTDTAGYFHIHVDGEQWWSGDFLEPSALTRLQVGNYAGLQRWPFGDPTAGELSWVGEARGCNTVSGSFSVDSVTYAGDTLKAIGLRFEQHCEGGVSALRGTMYWRSGDASYPPGPALPVPTTLWRPPAGATPSSGNYVFLSSDGGDFIGGGQLYLYTPLNATFTLDPQGGYLGIRVNGGSESWSGVFQAMSSLSGLLPGYYAGLRRYPFHNPAKGGLDWGGQGRGCNSLLGWVAIDGVTYRADTIASLDMRFEQHCEGGPAALHGAIHWVR